MRRCAASVVWVAGLLLLQGGQLHTYQVKQPLELTAILLDGRIEEEKPGTRLWLRIRNISSEPLMFCRSYWSYDVEPVDPNRPRDLQASASFHGCGDAEHDPFWLILPNESRFDSLQVKELPESGALLKVEVELIERSVFPAGRRTVRRLEWNGRLAEATAAGERLPGSGRSGLRKE